MTRSNAIEHLARRDLVRLSREEREVLLLDWWSIGVEDPEYDGLPDRLKEALLNANPTDDASASWYDPLLLVALRRSYVGVLNSYLQSQLAGLGHRETVEGEVEKLATCPCCGYKSLGGQGAYEICHVCFWEDDGTTDPTTVSGPNHMTLQEARVNTQRFGAITEDARAHVLSDGRARYALA